MLKHYIRVALKNITKEKFYSTLNITGLAIGFACFIVIALFIHRELQMERETTYGDNVYRVVFNIDMDQIEFKGIASFTPTGIAEYLNSGLPWVKRATTFAGNWQGMISDRKSVYEEEGLFVVDTNFFEVFSIPFLSGSADGFESGKKVILAESYAKKYFDDEEAVGKEILWGDDPYLVIGVVPDASKNSRYNYSLIFPISVSDSYLPDDWGNNSYSTFFKVSDKFEAKANAEELNAYFLKRFTPMLIKYFGVDPIDLFKDGDKYDLLFEQSKDIYLYSEGQDNFGLVHRIQFVYIFGIIAVLILLLASINYINLAVAKSVKRLKEIALRKSIGASKSQIIGQYLIESVIITLFAFCIGLVIVEFFIPYFNSIGLQTIEFQTLFSTGLAFILFVVAVLIGLISGSFPAFVLSKFNTIDGLKGLSQARSKGRWFKRGLVLFQLLISFFILSSTFLIDRQLDFLINKDLGFDKDQILHVKNANALYKIGETAKQELMKSEYIETVSFSTATPGTIMGTFSAQIEGRPSDQLINIDYVPSDEDFAKTLGLELVEGRYFSKDLASDSIAYVVNETFVKQYNLENPLETRIVRPKNIEGEKVYIEIIGVVKDYHYGNLYSEIQPMAAALGLPDWTNSMYVRVSGGNVKEAVNHIESYWNQVNPNVPLVYSFVSKAYNAAYESDIKTKGAFLIFAIIAIVIACLGLVGLVSYSSLMKRKEIGVRKVNGASTVQIAILLSKETIYITVISILLASPITVFFMRMWLEHFAYTIEIGAIHFILPAAMLLFIASLAEAFVIVSTARQNPIMALRYE